MRRLLLLVMICTLLTMPVCAMEFTAPAAPESAEELMPADTESFGEGVMLILRRALSAVHPEIAEAGAVCLAVIAIVMLCGLLKQIPGAAEETVEFAAVVGIGIALIGRSTTLIRLASDTVRELSEYGRMLLPVLTAALAAQGGTVTAGVLYGGTAAFNALLSSLISNLLVPMVYMFLGLSVASGAMGEGGPAKVKDLVKWLLTWTLKIVLYVFTGYLAITGAVSGTADAMAVKVTKITISSVVPVIGGILSDASETVLIGAGIMKNTTGVYGLLTVLAVLIAPFLKIGVQYLLLKATGVICAVFRIKKISGLIDDFAAAMGHLLGMTGTVSALLLISTVCFMKVVT